jgi:lysophospholipase L1-like esterase
MRSAARKKFFPLVAVLVGFLLALTIAEIGLRAADISYTVYPTRFQFGWPDSKTLDTDFVLDPVIQWKPKEYDQTLHEWQNKHIDIIHLGDSCTQLSNYRGELLRLMHERQPQKPFANLKLGVAGWSSWQGLQQLQRDIIPLKPRYITIYFGWNDHWLSYGIEDKNMNFSASRFTLYRSLQHLRVFQFFSFFYNRFLQQESSTERPLRVSPEDYRNNLRAMIKIARENSITPILITAPSTHRTGHEPAYLQGRFLNNIQQLIPLHNQYTDIVRDVAKQDGVLLLDLQKQMDAIPYTALRDKYMKGDGIHWQPAGGTAVAESLYQLIQENHLLD